MKIYKLIFVFFLFLVFLVPLLRGANLMVSISLYNIPFVLLLVLCILLLGLTFTLFLLSNRLKNQLVERQLKAFELQNVLDKQREQISNDLHDDVGSTLNSISVFSELAKQCLQNQDVQAAEHIDRISESARQLIDSIDDIVWVAHPKNDCFENIVLRMRLFASELLMLQNIKIDFRIDYALTVVQLSAEQRKNFYLIFKEAVNNVYKYAKCKNLKIDMHIHQGFVNMTIIDDGGGFDPESVKDGNGLRTIQKRADILRGYVRVLSTLQEGTTVDLFFPI